MTEEIKQNKTVVKEEFISLKDLFSLCLANWKWFVISTVICVCVGIAYLLTTTPSYTRNASILIKDDSKGQSGASSTADALNNLGLFQVKTNVINEISQLQSPDLMETVVMRLDLHTNYYRDGRFHKELAYGTGLPVKVIFADTISEVTGSLSLKINEDGTFTLSDFDGANVTRSQSHKSYSAKAGQRVNTPLGPITVYPTGHFQKGISDKLYVTKSNINQAINVNSNKLTVNLKDESGTVIDMSFKDVSTQRAEDVLNTIIQVYNENWVKDKNQIAVATSDFINGRLLVIENELGNVDSDISSYKSVNLTPDVQAASTLYMSESSQNNSQILAINNQIAMAKYIRDYLTSNADKSSLLPVNVGIENANIEQQIAQYNNIQLERNNIVASSSEKNPLVVDLDATLKAMNNSILSAIDNYITTLNISLQNLRQNDARITARIASSPTQAQHLLSAERQQKVMESLYLFLLQKREENQISQAFTAYNTRIISSPRGNDHPTSPVKRKILLVAIVIGLMIPIVVIFLKESLNNRVRGRKDIENLSMPFLGEIPYHLMDGNDKKKRKPSKSKRSVASEAAVQHVVVKEGSRDAINEAFRVLRTNLEFMSAKEGQSNVMIITSFNPGSGKTFLSINMGVSLALKEKKVLLIDGDLRHASLSACVGSPKTGLSDYLNGRENHLGNIILQDPQYANLHFLPVGTIPPNPSELLFNERMSQVMDAARKVYDYIFIDCPPVEIVADTQILEQFTDRTLFVIRAGLLERSMLTELEHYYNDKKFKNMALILNGTQGSEGYGKYGYKYGYRYGYKYGYKYGYSYGYGNSHNHTTNK